MQTLVEMAIMYLVGFQYMFMQSSSLSVGVGKARNLRGASLIGENTTSSAACHTFNGVLKPQL